MSARTYYECHVTMEAHPEYARPHVAAEGWKFSAIDGDPSLGRGLKCYATRHYNAKLPIDRVVELLVAVAAALDAAGCHVVRRKVELVVFDDRSATVKPCDGGCEECHLDDLG